MHAEWTAPNRILIFQIATSLIMLPILLAHHFLVCSSKPALSFQSLHTLDHWIGYKATLICEITARPYFVEVEFEFHMDANVISVNSDV